jgi:hypothetical protein
MHPKNDTEFSRNLILSISKIDQHYNFDKYHTTEKKAEIKRKT